MRVIYSLCFILTVIFSSIELSSQYRPDRGNPAPTPELSPLIRTSHRRRPTAILPEGLQLRNPDGTFYDLGASINPIGTPDHYIIGIIEPSGIIRPFYFHHRPVKVKRNGPGNFDIVPLTLQEYMLYGYNQERTSRNHSATEIVAEARNRNPGRGRS